MVPVWSASGLGNGARGARPRDEGGRYFEHPKRVALILMQEVGSYQYEVLVAALLHDVKEDTFVFTWEDLELTFGARVRELVFLLSRKDAMENQRVPKTLYRERIRNADEEVRLLKLADRLDNMRTLSACSVDKQDRVREETRRYYLSLARQTNTYLYEQLNALCE